MGTTTNYQIPYPELTDPPDGSGQMKALAQKVDTQLKAVDTAVRQTITNKAPWAMAAGSVSVVFANESAKAVVVTWPANRFSQAPMVSAVVASASVQYYPYASGVTATSGSIGCGQTDRAAGSPTIGMHWIAVQMTSASGPGRAAPMAQDDGRTIPAAVTCRTKGCENYGVPIDVQWRLDDPNPLTVCGPCGQPITEVVTG